MQLDTEQASQKVGVTRCRRNHPTKHRYLRTKPGETKGYHRCHMCEALIMRKYRRRKKSKEG